METEESTVTSSTAGESLHDASAREKPEKPTKDCVLIQDEFFVYVGPAAKSGCSLYRCLKCPQGLINKTLSCSDVYRQNLYKHIE